MWTDADRQEALVDLLLRSRGDDETRVAATVALGQLGSHQANALAVLAAGAVRHLVCACVRVRVRAF